MHKSHDYRAKGIFGSALGTRGQAATEVEIPPGESQRADIVFVPDPATATAPPDALGLLGRMCDLACVIEAFHDPPDTTEVLACVRKHLNWAHTRAGPAERDIGHQDERASTRLWIVSAGRPDTALAELGCQPLDGWPPGVYGAAPALRMGIVVIPELPRRRDTLLVRLAGRGVVLDRAIGDLLALPRDAPERRHALPILLQLRNDLLDARLPMNEYEQSRERIERIYREYEEHNARVVREGEQRGHELGEQHGQLNELRRLCVRRLRRPLSDDESAQLAARLAEHGPEPIEELLLDGTPDALAAWLARRETTPSAGTRIP